MVLYRCMGEFGELSVDDLLMPSVWLWQSSHAEFSGLKLIACYIVPDDW